MTSKEINLKTINNESIIGTGNISVGGGSADIVTSWEQVLSDTKVPSEKLTKNSLDDKISKSNTAGLVKNDGTIDTTSYVSDVSGKADKTSGVSQITDPNAHSNIGTSANATQSQINTAIDSMIGSAITYIVGSGS